LPRSNPFLQEVGSAVIIEGGPQNLTFDPATTYHLVFTSPNKSVEVVKRKKGRLKGVNSRKLNNPRTLPILPPTKLLARNIQNHPYWTKRRIAQQKSVRSSQQSSKHGSDSIQCPDVASQGGEEVGDSEEIGLEVVLPFDESSRILPMAIPSPLESREDFAGGSGVQILCNEGQDHIASREEEEAVKLMSIQEELGVRFNGAEREDLERAMRMEARDKKEKEDWEQNNSYQ
jgi:hypothetical protein